MRTHHKQVKKFKDSPFQTVLPRSIRRLPSFLQARLLAREKARPMRESLGLGTGLDSGGRRFRTGGGWCLRLWLCSAGGRLLAFLGGLGGWGSLSFATI